jgi:hypothetical protein
MVHNSEDLTNKKMNINFFLSIYNKFQQGTKQLFQQNRNKIKR